MFDELVVRVIEQKLPLSRLLVSVVYFGVDTPLSSELEPSIRGKFSIHHTPLGTRPSRPVFYCFRVLTKDPIPERPPCVSAENGSGDVIRVTG